MVCLPLKKYCEIFVFIRRHTQVSGFRQDCVQVVVVLEGLSRRTSYFVNYLLSDSWF